MPLASSVGASGGARVARVWRDVERRQWAERRRRESARERERQRRAWEAMVLEANGELHGWIGSPEDFRARRGAVPPQVSAVFDRLADEILGLYGTHDEALHEQANAQLARLVATADQLRVVFAEALADAREGTEQREGTR